MKRRPPRLHDAHWLALEVLRKKCPTRWPVEIRVVKRIRVTKGDPAGATVFDSRRRVLIIYLKAGRPFGEMADTVVHEWGHALAAPKCGHGPTWGKCFSRAYRAATGAP